LILWQVYKHKGNEKKLAEDARVARTSAEQSDARAETRLGTKYYYGDGVSQDYSKALSWYRKAADQGFSGGEEGLAYLYLHGQGVSQDYAEALRWYRKAAEQGDAKAETALALMYSHGRGVAVDDAEALRWLQRAAGQGYPAAEYDLGNVYYYGQGVAQDRVEADRWYRKAADQGDVSAQRALGLKGPGPSAFLKTDLLVAIIGSLMLLAGSWRSRHRDRRWRATALTGLVGVSYVGVDLYGLYDFGWMRAGYGIDAFYLVKHGLSGAFIVLLISVVYSLERPHRARMVLKVAGAVWVAFNIVAMMHFNLRHLVPAVRLFWMVNGLLVGMAIPLAAFLWRAGGRESRDGEVAAFEGPE
jgi:hypothetical protein